MREMRIDTWCDACHVETETKTYGETRTVQLPGVPTRTLDMCERHTKEMLGPIIELLTDHGVRPTPAELTRRTVTGRPRTTATQPGHTPADKRSAGGERADEFTCPICGETVLRHSAVGHVYGRHTPPGARPEYGRCPDCDAYPEGGKRAKTSTRAVTLHRIREHGFNAVDAAVAAARKAGV